MEPLQVAARFAAFACYLNTKPAEPACAEDAGEYARENWRCFLPYVHEDLGDFLTATPFRLNPRYGHRGRSRKDARKKIQRQE
jgi:hypothetical protein